MSIWELDKLFLFIAFVIPGFISIKTYDLFFPSTTRDSSKQIIDAIAYSCINYAVLLFPIYLIESNDVRYSNENWYVSFYVFVLFISPITLVYFWKLFRESDFAQNNSPHPTLKPWDYVFAQRKSYWVIVTLKDGNVIGGKYNSESFASSYPSPEQIYLEESWELNSSNDGFVRAHNQTAGVIIVTSEISHIELFNNE